MLVGFGKYADIDVRRVLVQHPEYVKWALEQESPKGRLGTLVSNLQRYIGVFDAKPFVEACMGSKKGVRCTDAVTRGTAYHSHSGFSPDLVWWCSACDPYQLGAVAQLINVSRYDDALRAVEIYSGRKSDYATIVKELSRGKGMPSRVTDAALAAFFGV